MRKSKIKESLSATPDLPKGLQWLLMGLLFLFLSLFFLYEQYHVPGFDYGKLVKYGEAIVENGEIFTTNYFSYSFPDYEFVNHHWGTGIIFYGLHQLGGFEMLTILTFIISMAAFLLVFFQGRKISNTAAMLFFSILVIPLMASRNQPRPEVFSALFFVLTMIILYNYIIGRDRFYRWIWFLPLIQVFWVNIHILFFLGLFLQGTVLLQLLINREKKTRIRNFGLMLLVSIIACMANPNGIYGLFYPMNIMKEISYPVAENVTYQSLIAGLPHGAQLQYEILFGLALLGTVLWFRAKELIRPNIYILIWLIAFGVLALWRIRAIALFSYVFLFFAATTFHIFSKNRGPGFKKGLNYFFVGMLVITLVVLINLKAYWYNPFYGDRQFGWGVKKELAKGAQFYADYNIKGPLFNNFDVGDYLIYYLFPETKVLIDGRPEAYPPEFINNKFLPAIFNEKKWLDLDYEYQFNAIFLAKHPQVADLIKRRLRDSEWFLIYNDKYNIIFIKMTGANRDVVRNDLIRKRNNMMMREVMQELDLMPEQF